MCIWLPLHLRLHILLYIILIPEKKQSFAKSVFLWMPTVYSSLLLSLQRFLYGLSFCPNTSVSRVTTDSWGNDWWEQVTNCSSQTQANEVCLFMLEPAHFSLWNFIGIMLLSNLGKDMQVGHQKFVNGPRCFWNQLRLLSKLANGRSGLPWNSSAFANLHALNSFRWFEIH